MKIILVGYMASGKSTIGKLLSESLHIPFYDLDDLIENNLNLKINEVFEQKGELFFRKLEHQLFVELLENDEDIIISTGGGTPCYFNNHELLQKEDVVSIYLKASIDTLFNRLVDEKHKRPLIAHLNKEETKEFIAKHLFDRSFYYNQATFKVNVDTKSIDEIVAEISNLLT